jgi:ribosomal protein S4E
MTRKGRILFPAKIVGKTVLKGGKMQLNLSAGINMLVEKNNFKTGETLMLDMPSKNMVDHLKLEKGAYVFLSGEATSVTTACRGCQGKQDILQVRR